MFIKYNNPEVEQETEQIPKQTTMKSARQSTMQSTRQTSRQTTKQVPEQMTGQIRIDTVINKTFQNSDTKPLKLEMSQRKLQEAIIWTEILGEPLCKRRKRR